MLLGVVNTKADVRLSKTLAGQLATLGARMQLAGDPSIPPEQLDYMAEAQSGLMLTMLVGQGVLIEDGDDYRSVARLHGRSVDAERQSAAVRASVAQFSASGGSAGAGSVSAAQHLRRRPRSSSVPQRRRLPSAARPRSSRSRFAPPRHRSRSSRSSTSAGDSGTNSPSRHVNPGRSPTPKCSSTVIVSMLHSRDETVS